MSMTGYVGSLRRILFVVRQRVRRVALKTRIAVLIGLIAVAGLLWQQHTRTQGPGAHPSASVTVKPAAPPTDNAEEPGPGSDPLPQTPVDTSVESARKVVDDFAKNFGTPNNNFDDWFARISPDLSPQLQEQYRLTDIRNIPQVAVTAVSGPVNQMPGTMAFNVAYDDGSHVSVRVEMGVEGWRVINVLPLSDDADSTANGPSSSPSQAPSPVPAPAG